MQPVQVTVRIPLELSAPELFVGAVEFEELEDDEDDSCVEDCDVFETVVVAWCVKNLKI
jgi:hypothetical protein